ncbi:hypothetical protein STEG23_020921, partial [Scotinomys teguina]
PYRILFEDGCWRSMYPKCVFALAFEGTFFSFFPGVQLTTDSKGPPKDPPGTLFKPSAGSGEYHVRWKPQDSSSLHHPMKVQCRLAGNSPSLQIIKVQHCCFSSPLTLEGTGPGTVCNRHCGMQEFMNQENGGVHLQNGGREDLFLTTHGFGVISGHASFGAEEVMSQF